MPTPVHDWILPRLNALIAEAMQNGMDREVVVAVITDIVEGPAFNDAVTQPQDEPQPTGLTDPMQEPISDRGQPILRGSWFPYSISPMPDPE